MSFVDSVKKVEALKEELAGLLPIDKAGEDRLWQKLRLEWNYNSNHIEGNTLTYGETVLLLIHDDTMGNHKAREYEEMKAHDVAISLIKKWSADKARDITEAEIRQLNGIVLKEPFWKEALTYDGQPTRRLIQPGEYKQHPNSVMLANGEMFHYAKPEEVPVKMKEVMDWYYTSSANLHPAQLAAELHYKFIRIHPFDDGNGRVARLLVNYVLMRSGYTPIVIKSNDKENYFRALRIADAGDIEPFCDYIAKQLIWSTELSLKTAKGESVEEPDDLDKKISLLEKDLNRINPDNSIQIHLDSETFLTILHSWVFELLDKLITTAQKFMKFFGGSSNHYVQVMNVHNSIAWVPFTNETPTDILTILREKIVPQLSHLNYQGEINIQFQTFYGTFEKSGLNTFGCVYGLDIKFDFIKYEILMDIFDESNKSQAKKITVVKSRLLHKGLTAIEADDIAAKFGNTIYRHIDHYTKNSGLI